MPTVSSHRPAAAALSALGASLAALVVSLAGPAVGAGPALAQGPVEIVFASGPDDSGTVEAMVAAFNEAHRGEIRVVWREMPGENDAHRQALLDALGSTTAGIDVLASDVVWTAELARDGRVVDLTDRFYDAFDREVFLPAPLRSATDRLRIWGVPWYTDAGLLFYRRDRLAESGFGEPPATWETLTATARQVMADSGTPWGFVFQGAAYEGGTANAAEFIWSAGGEIMSSRLEVTGLVVTSAAEVDSVSIGSPEAARGLDIARGLITDGVAPPEVAEFREADALDAFRAGEALFLRSWPYAYRVLRRAGFTTGQLGVAPLPAARGGESASSLGGWNLMINASSADAERDASWRLIRYLTDPARQRRLAVDAGLLPVLRPLYDDAELQEANPVMGVGARVFATQLRERPMTPFYGELSARVASAFNRTLRGELTGAQAVALLEEQLREILVRNR